MCMAWAPTCQNRCQPHRIATWETSLNKLSQTKENIKVLSLPPSSHKNNLFLITQNINMRVSSFKRNKQTGKRAFDPCLLPTPSHRPAPCPTTTKPSFHFCLESSPVSLDNRFPILVHSYESNVPPPGMSSLGHLS